MAVSGKQGKGRRKPAERHHGDLRRALVEATLRLIEAGETHRVTLRSVARAVGVSHMAPYNHFADKAALIAAAGAEGFRRLRKAMEQRMAAFEPGDPLRLQAVGLAYVAFAVANPELFRLMFGPELADTSSHAELAGAAREVLETLVGALGAAGVATPSGDAAAEFAITPWALVHGLAMLAVAHQLPVRGAQQIEALAAQSTRLLFFGLRNAMGPQP
jgi:AcrR family transcriptional regulator